MGADIRFPNLGITIDSLGKSISVGGFSIAYYGIIIAVGMIAGFYMASWQAKRLVRIVKLFLIWHCGIFSLPLSAPDYIT